jgi:hypothetical protein
MGKDDMLCLLGMFSCFQPSLGVSHEDLGSYFILEAIDKSFLEEGINHTLCAEIQVLKGNDKIFQLFQTISTWSSGLNGGCLCQSIHTTQQQNVSKKHTLGVHFDAITTISIVMDPNREHCNESWSSHQ